MQISGSPAARPHRRGLAVTLTLRRSRRRPIVTPAIETPCFSGIVSTRVPGISRRVPRNRPPSHAGTATPECSRNRSRVRSNTQIRREAADKARASAANWCLRNASRKPRTPTSATSAARLTVSSRRPGCSPLPRPRVRRSRGGAQAPSSTAEVAKCPRRRTRASRSLLGS